MKIETVPIETIKPNNWNPNEMDKQVFSSLVESVRRHGILQPVLVSSDFSLIKGEKRWRAARKAGLKEIICVVVDTKKEESKLLNVSLNTLRGQTNDEMMAALLDELAVHFSLEDISVQTGYEKENLQQILSDLPHDTDMEEPVEEDDFDVQEALDRIKEPETKYGEVWKLGRHTLVCGDATRQADIQRLMDGDKANLVVTDPPYNVAVASDSPRLSENGTDKIMNDDMSAEDFNSFLGAVFKRYSSIMKDKAAIYVFHGSSHQREFESAMNAADIVSRTQCIWVKNSPTFGWSQYRFQHEPIFYAHLKGKSPAWYGDRKQSTVWKSGLPVEEPEPATVWEVSRGDVSKYVHPTQKPLELLAIPISNSSKQEDVVVDLFGGSGSTLMTCEQMKRTCRLMELDPVFCDVIKKRFFEATGIKPVLLSRMGETA
jgi:ParB/RepB/Spo0J family partition protein